MPYIFRKGLLYLKHMYGRNPVRKSVQCLLRSFLIPAFQPTAQCRAWSRSRATGSVANAKRRRRPSVRTTGVVDSIEKRITASRRKFFRNLSQQADVKPSTCFRTICRKLKPNCVTCTRITSGRQGEVFGLLCLASQQSSLWRIRHIAALYY